MSKLSSGLRINRAGDDPGGLAISERLRVQYRNSAAAASNVENKINYLQTVDSWLQKMQDMMHRMGELAVMANDGTKSDVDRMNLQREFVQMQKEIQRITSGNTAAGKFNGLYLFRGGTGVPTMANDLVEGFPTRTRGYVANQSHDGSGISASTWRATYNAEAELWTVLNVTTQTVEGYINAAPGQGGTIDLEGPSGFRFWFDPPAKGSFCTGDEFTWTNVPYTNPVMGVGMSFANRHATTTGGPTEMLGTGSGVSTSDWVATYDAVAEQWTIRNETTGVDVGTVSAGPEQGGSIDLEGVNGFRLTIQTPTAGSYATGDRLRWSNTAYILPVMGGPVLQDSSGATSGTASATMLGDGMGLTTHAWRATYNSDTELWTLRNVSAGTDIGTIAAAPNEGGSMNLIQGANGFNFVINAPTGGTEYTMGDQFTWNNQGYVAPVLGGAGLIDVRGATSATASPLRQGDGSGITSDNWSATYNALTHQWVVRNETTATDFGTITALPDAGGALNNIQGPNGFSLTINAPAFGQYTHGDRFAWTNQTYIPPVRGPTSFVNSDAQTTGSASLSHRGNGSGVSTTDWSALYNSVSQQWVVRNETLGVDVGTVSAAPDTGGVVNLEGVNGFQLAINAPTAGTQYTMGDRYTWSNAGYVAPVRGPSTFTDAGLATGGSGTSMQLGDGAAISTADWSATYDAVSELWTVRNLTTGTDVGTVAAAPDSGGSIDLEGANGFRYTIQAPSFGTYDTGDELTWSTTAHTDPAFGSPLLTDDSTATVGSCSTAQSGNGDWITSADWSATYDAVSRQWTLRNETLGTVVDTLTAAPNVGGVINLEGANGFQLTIDAPTVGYYTTGDRFEWHNTAHVTAAAGAATLIDSTTPTVASAGSVMLGDGSAISTASWQARYNAVTEQWAIRNVSTGTVVGSISAAPNAGGSIDLEGPNGFRFTLGAPTSGLYNSGDRYNWVNVRHVDPGTGSVTLQDNISPSVGSATTAHRGDGTSVTTAGWDAVYDAVARAWTIRNLTTGTVEGTISASPLQGGGIDLEGANGFRFSIGAPTSGAYDTGDRFIWSNQAHIPPVIRNGRYEPAATPATSTSATVQGDGYHVSSSTWQAIYDASAHVWTVVNMSNPQVAGTISAAPDEGGTLSNIEGLDGFSLTIHAPANGSYSTGDIFTWSNEEHLPASPGIADFTDIHTGAVTLQVGPDSNQVFREQEIVLESDYYKVIGSVMTYRYGSVNMTLLGSLPVAVTWASLINPQEITIGEQAQAQRAVGKIGVGTDHLSSLCAMVGAELNRMEQTLGGLRNYEENIRHTESRIRDVDVAFETTRYAKFKILSEIAAAILAQANAIASSVLDLVQ